MLIADLPTSGIQNPGQFTKNSLDFTKFPLTKYPTSMLFLKTLGCKNDVLEYQVKLEKC